MNFRAPIDRVKSTPHRDLEHIHLKTGLGIQTIRALKYGTAKDPRISTAQKLFDYFARLDAGGFAPPVEAVKVPEDTTTAQS